MADAVPPVRPGAPVEGARAPLVLRLAGPVTVGAAALAGAAVVAVVDPNEPGHYPACPFLALTGWWCPGCGSLRALHALAGGDPATALARNPVTVAAVPVLVVLWAVWLRRSITGAAPGRPVPMALVHGSLLLLVAFTVLRNMPGFAWLAP